MMDLGHRSSTILDIAGTRGTGLKDHKLSKPISLAGKKVVQNPPGLVPGGLGSVV